MTRKLLLVAAAALVAAGAARAGGFEGPTIAHPVRVPDFALRDQSGKIVRLSAERGNVVLLTFMYTHCQDLCPLTAVHLDSAALRAASPKVQILAVTVDPRGDTRASVRRFVSEHGLHSEFHYLTGPLPVLRSVWTAYHVTTSRYGTHADHTLYTMLIDPSGRDRVLYDSTASAGAISHDARMLLQR